mgnify:CR=1 FL=1
MMPFTKYLWKMGYTRIMGITTIIVTVIRTLVGVWLVATAAAMDARWIRVRPGTDAALALGMLNVIINEEIYDKEFVDCWCYGFDELAERSPFDLSGGQQRRVAFAGVLAMEPEVLVLDEPVDGLDPVMRRQVWNLVLADVAENGTTVLISSHNLRELEDVCDHVGIMNGGKVLLEHPLSELQANIVKVLVALPDGTELPEGLDILHQSSQGHLYTLIVHGDAAEVTNRLSTAQPQYLDVVPLTLEEIFIYEMGGEDYAVRDIML